jgi:hypothetical protein
LAALRAFGRFAWTDDRGDGGRHVETERPAGAAMEHSTHEQGGAG